MKADEKKCPQCAEVIKAEAKLCKHCGHKLTEAEIAADKRKKSSEAVAGGIGCVVFVIIAALGLSMCSGGESETPEQVAAREKATADDRQKGMHCLSAWDGSNSSFVDGVKRQLRDPDSFEHDETRITPVDDQGKHMVVMEYRARNGFGGMNRDIAMGVVDQTSCDATVTTISATGEQS